MDSQASLSIVHLILDAGFVVKCVLLALIAMAVFSFAIIYQKVRTLKRVEKDIEAFLNFFWEADALSSVFSARDKFRNNLVGRVFNKTYREFQAIPKSTSSNADTLRMVVDNVERQYNAAAAEEISRLEKNLPILAITASAAPFIGLFGTVWGIMDSFISIGAQGSTSLAVVAPGIAEALIATALGLFAAIPAVIFFNLHKNRIRQIQKSLAVFEADLTNIMVRGRAKQGTGADKEAVQHEVSV